ncbi:MAG: chloride channel protein [Janthinobacterium lividum]
MSPQPDPVSVAARSPLRHGKARRPLADFAADRRVLLLVAMALVVGTGSAFAAWVLVRLIAFVTNLVWFGRLDAVSFSLAPALPGPWMVAAPVLGGIAIGLMARYGSEKIRGHGIPEAIEAILIGESRMSPKVALLKPLSSAISIGTGGPFGAEGPIIMTGGAIGSLFAQFFRLSAAERKTLLVAGAAAGMTGIFGTPVAAVLLAVELLLFEWRPRSFIPVSAAALTAICWRPLLLGSGPLFPLGASSPTLFSTGLLLAALVGLTAGLLSGLLTRLLYASEDWFERLPIHWMWWPAIGGLVVGLGGLIEPRALGVGYDVIRDLLDGHLAGEAVLVILLVKAVIWLIALSSGTSGGVLAPLLILGGAVGSLLGLVLPGHDPGYWALLGMSAMLGGTMRAPLTATIFAIELTGDMHALPALLAATVTAYAVTVLLMKRSILTEKLARRGQHITREYGIDPFELARVSEIMVRSVDTLSADMLVPDAVSTLEAGTHRAYPVLDAASRPVGFVTRADALRWAIEGGHNGERLGDRVSDAAIAIVHPDDVLTTALDLMLASDQGRIPVTDPSNGALVGLVTRKDLLQVRASVARAETERLAYFVRRQSNPIETVR